MRLLAMLWCLFGLGVCPLAGCADTGPSRGTGGTGGAGLAVISVACSNNLTDDLAILHWELDVSTKPIEGGEPFTTILSAVAVFSESYLDSAQPIIRGGVREVNLVDVNATVHVRSGAVGADVILTNEPIPYECFAGRTTCDPANDLEGVPGLRGNTDCQPESAINPCGRFVLLSISSDCASGGVCDELGKTGPASQCELNGFCVTGGLRVSLEEASGQYVANVRGDVLVGWDDESTGANLRESGPNAGTWILPQPVYEEPTGPNGFRVTVAGLPVAVDCTMGVNSQGPLGVDSLDFLSSPTPDSALISLSIQPVP